MHPSTSFSSHGKGRSAPVRLARDRGIVLLSGQSFDAANSLVRVCVASHRGGSRDPRPRPRRGLGASTPDASAHALARRRCRGLRPRSTQRS